MKVLLVEDHLAFAELCRELLSAVRGVRVVKIAATGEEACTWLLANPQDWDLVVADLFLSSGHGFKVIQACRDRHAMQRVVVLSGYADATARQYAQLAGADGFFSKESELGALVSFCTAFAAELYDGSRKLSLLPLPRATT